MMFAEHRHMGGDLLAYRAPAIGRITNAPKLLWFPATFKFFNNLGNLLFAKGQPKGPQHEGFCHGPLNDWIAVNLHLFDSSAGNSDFPFDLLRVKRVVGFFRFPDFYPVLITFNHLGNLLFARSVTPVVVVDGVLIRFPFHVQQSR